jgi:hypothetical protein
LSAVVDAQTTQLKLKVTVPFDFIAGDTALPAGDYDIQSIDAWEGKALSIHSVTLNAGTLVLSTSSQPAKISDRNTLVFYRYGQKYFLAEVWIANTNIGRQMLLNQRQRESARNQQKSEVVLTASGK